MTSGTIIHTHAEKDWVKRELRAHGAASVFGREDLTLEQALQLVDDCPTEFIPVGRCEDRDERGICRGHETPQNRVSFCTDDAPDDDDAVRLHILALDDYYVSIGPGHTPPFDDGFRACCSGARDPRVTFLFAALYRLGRGDLDGAVVSARAFIAEVEARIPDGIVTRDLPTLESRGSATTWSCDCGDVVMLCDVERCFICDKKGCVNCMGPHQCPEKTESDRC